MMLHFRLRRWLVRFSRRRSVRSAQQHPQQYRLVLEDLEARLNPMAFTVTNTSDAAIAGSLRFAVDQANALGGTNTISFDPSIAGQMITLTANDTLNPFAFGPTALVIGTPARADNLTLIGDPSLGITLSGNSTHRIFGVLGSAGGSTLTLQFVTVTGGSVTGGRGGGLASQDSTLGGGGGAGLGGAIFVAGGGTLNVVQSTLTGNTATGGAGGVSTVYNGQPRGAMGGGGSSAFAGGDAIGGTQGTSGGGGGIAGAGQSNVVGTGGAGGLNEVGVAAPGGGGVGGAGSNGTLGGGGGGANNGYLSVRGGDGIVVSSGGFGGGGGGTWGTNGPGDQGGNGGFGAGGGAGFWGGGNGGFGGGAGAQWGGPASVPGFGGGANGGSASTWGVGAGGGAGMGGTIFNNGGTVNITNSTITASTATGGAGGTGSTTSGVGGLGLGAAIFNRNGSLSILNSTIAGNTAVNGGGVAGTGSAGGIYNLSDGAGQTATLTLANSIISGSTATSDVVNDRVNAGVGTVAIITGTTPNVVQTAIVTQNGATTSGSGVVNTDPILGALANNGGPTRTMVPGTGPAIDTGSNVAAAGLINDQRGFIPRIFGTNVDLGAVEVGATAPAAPAITSASSATFTAGTAGTFTVTTTGNPVPTITRSGALPAGVMFTDNGDGTATLSGTPTGGGVFRLTFTAGNGVAPDATQVFTLTVSVVSAPRSILVTGAGAGSQPRVNVYDARTGAIITQFLAYDPAFLGGVRVAVGDVNGDGVVDIITGAGPGAGPHVKVFDGVTFQPLASFLAYDAGFTGGVFVAAGDVNGDGKADIITGAGPGAGAHVKVFDGATLQVTASYLAYEGFSGGVFVAAGDVNGDGKADIITGTGPGAPPHVKVFDGATLQLLASYLTGTPGLTGVQVAASDVNGDGLADIITGVGAGAAPVVKVFDGATFQQFAGYLVYDTAFTGGVFVAAVDVDGDGKADIVTGAGPGAGPHVKVLRTRDGTELFSFLAFGDALPDGVFVAAGAT